MLEALPRLWGVKTPRREHTTRAEVPASCPSSGVTVREVWEVKSPAKPARRGQNTGFLKAMTPGLEALPLLTHFYPAPSAAGPTGTCVDTGKDSRTEEGRKDQGHFSPAPYLWESLWPPPIVLPLSRSPSLHYPSQMPGIIPVSSRSMTTIEVHTLCSHLCNLGPYETLRLPQPEWSCFLLGPDLLQTPWISQCSNQPHCSTSSPGSRSGGMARPMGPHSATPHPRSSQVRSHSLQAFSRLQPTGRPSGILSPSGST